MILFLIFTLGLLLGPDHNLKTCSTILHFLTSKSHNFSIIKTHTILFFLKHLRPKSIGRADWPGTLRIQTRTLPYWGVTMKTRTYFLESGQFYARLRARSLPGTTKAKLASLLHANHWRREMPHKDRKAQLTLELAPPCRRLQEQFPGAPTWAMSRKWAQSGCWHWPHQLLGGS